MRVRIITKFQPNLRNHSFIGTVNFKGLHFFRTFLRMYKNPEQILYIETRHVAVSTRKDQNKKLITSQKT